MSLINCPVIKITFKLRSMQHLWNYYCVNKKKTSKSPFNNRSNCEMKSRCSTLLPDPKRRLREYWTWHLNRVEQNAELRDNPTVWPTYRVDLGTWPRRVDFVAGCAYTTERKTRSVDVIKYGTVARYDKKDKKVRKCTVVARCFKLIANKCEAIYWIATLFRSKSSSDH